jgi:3',5'-cyclic AMP phosphodiesterase CpdA
VIGRRFVAAGSGTKGTDAELRHHLLVILGGGPAAGRWGRRRLLRARALRTECGENRESVAEAGATRGECGHGLEEEEAGRTQWAARHIIHGEEQRAIRGPVQYGRRNFLDSSVAPSSFVALSSGRRLRWSLGASLLCIVVGGLVFSRITKHAIMMMSLLRHAAILGSTQHPVERGMPAPAPASARLKDLFRDDFRIGTAVCQSPWYRIIGPDSVAQAFAFAREADPAAELYYNEYSMENAQKRVGAVRLVESLLAQGLKVTAVGMHDHLTMNWPSVADEDATINAFAALGVKVNITELDVDVLPQVTQNRSADVNLRSAAHPALNPYATRLPDSVQLALARRYVAIFRVFLAHRLGN